MAKTNSKTHTASAEVPQMKAQESKKTAGPRLKGLICTGLILLTLVAYWRVFGCKFIECYDDESYVTANRLITSGINLRSVEWSFTTFRCSNWHPLTWLSHIADYSMYGLNPTGHHLTSLLFHIGNALLLFLLLSRMTGAVWRSAFVAAVFAVHPLHVESAAWIAERKDVLSTFFCFVTLYAYALYVQRPCVLRYLSLLVAFALGLMSKPMLVSLPIMLLLLDFWPLNRAHLKWRLVWEKAPLFAISAAACVVTVIAQRAGGAVISLGNVPLGSRIVNAAVAYAWYILKMLWPSHLAVFYPHQTAGLPLWQAIAAGLALIAVSIVIFGFSRRRPYLATGWMWYLITLVPVIGLVQVGSQAYADRYSYIPLTGLFVIIAWGVPELVVRFSLNRFLIPVVASAVVLMLAMGTWLQIGNWKDSYTLFDHAIKVTSNNHIAYNNRGMALNQQGRYADAISDFEKALEIFPDFPEAENGLGIALVKTGKAQEGVSRLRTALDLGLDDANVHENLGYGYYALNRLEEASDECETALRLDPMRATCENTLGSIRADQRRLDEAIKHWESAAALDPKFAEPHWNLAMGYFFKADFAAAWKQVHTYENQGGEPNERFLSDLSRQMPDPGP